MGRGPGKATLPSSPDNQVTIDVTNLPATKIIKLLQHENILLQKFIKRSLEYFLFAQLYNYMECRHGQKPTHGKQVHKKVQYIPVSTESFSVDKKSQ